VHTGKQIFPSDIGIDVDGESVGLDALFPGYHRYDRFGIVVSEPFGTTGASLLITAAIAAHFETRPERRGSGPAYPEVYVFHVGRRFGDHSWYDIWPPRKEVFVETGQPWDVLTAVNARGITRLAVPDVVPGDVDRLSEGPSTWAEQASAHDRLASCFAYSARGEVGEADVVLRELGRRAQENTGWTLDPIPPLEAMLAMPEQEAKADLPGNAVLADNYRWAELVRQREHEVPGTALAAVRNHRDGRRAANGGRTIESVRRITIDRALELLAGI
jgi:hypothetical protein